MSPLAAEGVTVRFGARTVLDAVSARFRTGEITAVVGPNGAGKSTLLACLAGLRRPAAGNVRLGEEALAAMPGRARARHIGFLPQQAEIAWPVEVEVLVGLGRIPHAGPFGPASGDAAAIEAALAATATTSLRHRDVTTLSGGERSRVLLARVLAGEPDWLLADEPLVGLDPGHQLDTLALLRDFAAASARGVIVTLHDLNFAMRAADQIVVLAEGRIAAIGTPREALKPDILAAVYGVEARWLEASGGPVLELRGRQSPSHNATRQPSIQHARL
jgi:iron complex transport system ATP-binding protein